MKHSEVVARLRGIFPPVATTFARNGGLDLGRFRANLERYVGIGLGGILVTGSTGEAPYLAERERLRLVEVARRVVRPPELLIVGTGLESTPETVTLSRKVIDHGADALLVVTPNYYKARMDSAALVAHYRALADALRHPIIIYSIPQFTGIHIAVDAIAELSRHRHIVGLKESSGDLKFVRSIIRKTRPGFRLLVGSARILLDALRAGAAGAILAQADFAPALCVAVDEAFRQGRFREARALQERLEPLAQRISVPYGVAGVKAAMDLSGYAGGPVRLPLLPLNRAERAVVERALREAQTSLAF
jgi:4-hydroxy-2-oxoglutarate aldolase